MYEGFGYCRVSSQDQNLERQIEAVSDFAKTNYKVELIPDENLFCDQYSKERFQSSAMD